VGIFKSTEAERHSGSEPTSIGQRREFGGTQKRGKTETQVNCSHRQQRTRLYTSQTSVTYENGPPRTSKQNVNKRTSRPGTGNDRHSRSSREKDKLKRNDTSRGGEWRRMREGTQDNRVQARSLKTEPSRYKIQRRQFNPIEGRLCRS